MSVGTILALWKFTREFRLSFSLLLPLCLLSPVSFSLSMHGVNGPAFLFLSGSVVLASSVFLSVFLSQFFGLASSVIAPPTFKGSGIEDTVP